MAAGRVTPELADIAKEVEQADIFKNMIVIDCDFKGDESNILVTFLKKWTIRVNMVTKYHEIFGIDQIHKIKANAPDY